jgi:hypothetical protein
VASIDIKAMRQEGDADYGDHQQDRQRHEQRNGLAGLRDRGLCRIGWERVGDLNKSHSEQYKWYRHGVGERLVLGLIPPDGTCGIGTGIKVMRHAAWDLRLGNQPLHVDLKAGHEGIVCNSRWSRWVISGAAGPRASRRGGRLNV